MTDTASGAGRAAAPAAPAAPLHAPAPGRAPSTSTPLGPPRPSTPAALLAPPLLTSPNLVPTLSPSPAFLEQHWRPRDDEPAAPPETPQRAGAGLRGVSLQLSVPTGDGEALTPGGSPSRGGHARAPVSPRPDGTPPPVAYSPGGSVLPRRSRGLDYTRACTNLHHSTLAEQPSPDASPVVGGRGVAIPRRGRSGNSGSDSPMFSAQHWSLSGGAGDARGGGVAGSLSSSVNMLGSGSESSSSDGGGGRDDDEDDGDDDGMGVDDDDTIHVTPQPFRNNNIFGITGAADALNPYQQAAASLMSFQRRTRRRRSTRHSSSSASGRSSMASPIPGSPPVLKTVESGLQSGYFDRELRHRRIESRRESLSLGTGDLKISDSIEEDGSGGQTRPRGITGSENAEGRRNVIRRAVTRRSNMLPKPKMLARIQAALQEEVSPVDAECKREAEVIRQVKESDHSPESTAVTTQPPTTVSSPSLQPLAANTDAVDELADLMDTPGRERRGSSSFSKQALRNSIGADFWNQFDNRVRTPPPPFFGRGSSSGISEDVNMDTPASSISLSRLPTRNSSPSRSTTPQPASSAGDSYRVALGKRRRDDDIEPHLFKRRAVSPGVSHQNSPVLPPSPAQRDGALWGTKGERSGGSSGSTSIAGGMGKRVGLQGMNDTNDGLMNMTIE